MNLCFVNHNFRYELEKLVRIFLPFEKIEFFDSAIISDCSAVTELYTEKAVSTLYLGEKVFTSESKIDKKALDADKENELKLALSLFECFKTASEYIPSWGILTGVRPAKLYSRLVKKDGVENTDEYFKNILKVSDKKLRLCKETFLCEEEITSLSVGNSFSLYISIPFCPTRCAYCSFVSHSVKTAKKLIPQYIDKLCKELEITADIVKNLGLRLETIYIGGGTPTSFEAEEIAKIMETVNVNFDLSELFQESEVIFIEKTQIHCRGGET